MISALIVETDSAYLRADEYGHWRKNCILSFADRNSLTSFLRFDPAASQALVDVIVFLMTIDVTPERATECSAVSSVVGEIRRLPPGCCLRDGRKWSKLPAVALACMTFRGIEKLHAVDTSWCRYNGCLTDEDTRLFYDVLQHLHGSVDAYREQLLENYVKVGILVDYSDGRFRVKWAFRQRRDRRMLENDYYFGPADRRTLADYVTVHRDVHGISHEARLFEELINTPNARERDLQRFLELHPAFLMDALRGIPLPHTPVFRQPRGWTPDFTLPSAAALRLDQQVVQVAELKGVHVPLLSGRLHRRFSHQLMTAINQVRDYAGVLEEQDELNRERITKAFGYLPRQIRKAVVIGRAPRTHEDSAILQKRRGEQPDVRIVNYDELLSTQYEQIV
jgi:hypothetical protein